MMISGLFLGKTEAINCMAAISIGFVLDLLFADSHRFPHPIRLLGVFIDGLEHLLYGKNNENNRINHLLQVIRGLILELLVLMITIAYLFYFRIACYGLGHYWGILGDGIIFYFCIAPHSLYLESMAVYHQLRLYAPDLDPARKRLSWIVGRDTMELSEEKIICAAVETVAENTSDGVIAPFFYMLLLGPIGAGAYKAVNTMDSMFGYRNKRYEFFGKCAARVDDLANLIPSRLSAIGMLLGGVILKPFLGEIVYPVNGLMIWIRDRYKHKSPNSAQTESACAGILGILLGGDSRYFGKIVKKPTMGNALRPVIRRDIWYSNLLMIMTTVIMYAAALGCFFFCLF